MTTVSKATGAPSMITLGGKKYQMSPLQDEDYGVLERWVQDKIIELAKRNLAGLEETQKTELLKHAFNEARRVTLIDPQALKHLQSVDGAVLLVWLMLKTKHPDITQEEVAEQLLDEAAMSSAMTQVDRLVTDEREFRETVKKGEETSPQTEQ